MDTPKPKLLDEVRDRIRVKHYSIRTEQSYIGWIRRFIIFHGKRHPLNMGATEVTQFLTNLAVAAGVAPSTQNQAKAALLFLYKEVLDTELPWLYEIVTAKSSQRLPVVLTQDEVQRLLNSTGGTNGLILRLLYGTGMRIMECLRLRVKDVEFARNEIIIREGKGAKDRMTMLPQALVLPLREHLTRVQRLHQQDLLEGFGDTWLPYALARKYPNANKEWGWQDTIFAQSRSCSAIRTSVRL